jgi:signal transduction histidine kinase/ligand-binding sensor domain-containing protein
MKFNWYTASAVRFIVLTAVLWIHTASSQLLPFRSLTVRDGLPSNSTTTLYLDSKGFLWIGSYDGFCRYDGYTFRTTSVADGLPSNHITAFAESRRDPGRMFIGTSGGGVAEFDTEIRRRRTYGSGIVLSLLEDHRGYLWCGTDNELIRYAPDSLEPVIRLSGTGPVQQIRESGDSLLWVMTKTSGLLCFTIAEDKETIVEIPEIKRFDPILISERTGGVRWMTDRNGNFICVRGTRIIRSIVTNDPQHHALSLVGVDSLSFWFGTVRGIFHAVPDRAGKFTFLNYSQSNGLPEQIVLPILFDHENNLWMRSFSKGLVILPDERVLTYRMTPAPMVMNDASVKEDRTGTVWMTSTDGLMEFRSPGSPASAVFIHHPEDESKYGFANALHFDRSGNMWIKYWHGNIVRYSIATRTGQASVLKKLGELVPGRDIPKGTSSVFLTDRDGALFFAVEELGLFRCVQNGRDWKIDTIGGTPGNKITALMEDQHGTIWAGGTDPALSVLRNGAPHSEPVMLDSSLKGRTIRSFVQQRNGTIWAGTSAGELVKIEEENVTDIIRLPLLQFSTIWSIRDEGDLLWLGTAKGLMLYDTKTRELSAPTGTISSFAVYSHCITASGMIAAVSEEGGHFFELASAVANEEAPRIDISSFTVNGLSIDPSSPIELSPDENTCTVEFFGLTYTQQRSLRYVYTLHPVDGGTKHITPHRAVTFASLSPGTYTFSVTALTFRGMESRSAASISFTILPPFWQRWWFIAASIIIGGMVLISVYRYRVNRLLEVERIRSRIAMDLHDEIGSTLSGISVLSELLKNENAFRNEQSLRMLERIGTSARRMMESMNDIVWTLNPQHDTMEQFASKVRMTAAEILEPRGITCTVSIPESSGTVLSMDGRRQMYLIIKEALHNIGKHSGGTAAAVEITLDRRKMHVRISDNGRGFAADENGTRNGMKNMRRRAAALNAQISVNSVKGSGTSIEVMYDIT